MLLVCECGGLTGTDPLGKLVSRMRIGLVYVFLRLDLEDGPVPEGASLQNERRLRRMLEWTSRKTIPLSAKIWVPGCPALIGTNWSQA
jgi:hypothetical protein